MNPDKEITQNLLSNTGITLDGQNPYDIQVYHSDFYSRILKDGARGLGESYVEGWWECKKLDEFFKRLFEQNVESKARQHWRLWSVQLQNSLFNRYPEQVGLQAELHREGRDFTFYQKMLGNMLLYQCADWDGLTDLQSAQEQRLLLVCEQLQLKKGETLLDLGCGWGGLAFYAAKHYGVKVVGVTSSVQQFHYATKLCKGLPIQILLKDIREIKGVYDKIVCIRQYDDGGELNYKELIETAYSKLKYGGIGVFDLLSSSKAGKNQSTILRDFVFPENFSLRRLAQTVGLVEKYFVLDEMEHLSKDYVKTLHSWQQNFKKHTGKIKTDREMQFYRKWNYYLSCLTAAFKSREYKLYSYVVTKSNQQQRKVEL